MGNRLGQIVPRSEDRICGFDSIEVIIIMGYFDKSISGGGLEAGG